MSVCVCIPVFCFVLLNGEQRQNHLSQGVFSDVQVASFPGLPHCPVYDHFTVCPGRHSLASFPGSSLAGEPGNKASHSPGPDLPPGFPFGGKAQECTDRKVN